MPNEVSRYIKFIFMQYKNLNSSIGLLLMATVMDTSCMALPENECIIFV